MIAAAQSLAKFLEMDILEFLDKKKAGLKPREGGAEGYYEEVRSALLKNNVSAVEDVLEKAADEYNRLADNDPYKDIAYNKFLEAIQLLEKYEARTHSKELGAILGLVADNKIQEGKPSIINIFEERKKERERRVFEKKEKAYEKKEALKAKIRMVMHELFINIRKKDISSSVLSYKKLRKQFEEFPSGFKEEKKEIYNDLLSYYIQIKKLKKELRQQRVGAEKPLGEAPVEEEKGKYLKPEEVNSIVQGIRSDVKNRNFDDAKSKILELRHMISMFPEDQKHARALFESKINNINQKVEFAKRRWEHSRH